MKAIVALLLDLLKGFMAGQAAQQDLGRRGAGPVSAQGSLSVDASLPTLAPSVADDEAGRRITVVEFMRSQLGKGYQLGVEVVPGHEDEAQSWDCSEAVEHAYREAGMRIPDGAQQQYDACQAVRRPLPGDLGFLWSDKRGMIGHVMVCATEGTVVHAVGGRGVVEDPSTQWEYHQRWRGWRRHVDFARPKEDRA